MTKRRPAEMLSRLSFAPAFLAALLLAGGLAAIFYEETLYDAQTQQEAMVQANILAASVSAPLFFDDAATAEKYVAALAENPQILSAAVYNDKGQTFATFVRPGADPVPPSVSPGTLAYEAGMLTVTAPIVEAGKQIGIVYVRMGNEPLGRRLLRYGGLIGLITLGVLVIAVIGVAQRALSQQAQQLREANQQLQVEMEQRSRTEHALRQAQKMEAIGQLSGGIAHDFNNLITIAKGSLRGMLRRLPHPQTDIERYVKGLTDALDRAAILTQRILAFARQQPLTPRPVDLSQLITEMDQLLQHSVGSQVAIQLRLQPEAWTICDVNQMENVILNLAINARDAMPEGGQLTMETKVVSVAAGATDLAPGEYVELLVSDTGAGMSEEVRQKAVDPFFTTKPVGQGTGLGLSVAFGYVRQSNGQLLIDSTPGKGTTIRILMPTHLSETTA
jgi:signal transduction histidine kinase